MSVFRVHPAIGIARVGNSDQYYLAPETMAGMPGATEDDPSGGLPINPATEKPIKSTDLRDEWGAMKRQAARFRVFQYPDGTTDAYPTGAGSEVQIGDEVDGKKVADIVWTVHVANKKANGYVTNTLYGAVEYDPAHPEDLALRNAAEGPDPTNPARIRKLVIDPGPRAISGRDRGPVNFDKSTRASYCAADGSITPVPAYPKSFPDFSFTKMYTPTGPIDTLGELRTEERGRLHVIAGPGKACAWLGAEDTPAAFVFDVNCDKWLDDTGDGPVHATLVFEDGSTATVHPAWAILTDPGWAPQIRNIVTLWDDMYDTWVRQLDLAPDVFDTRFQTSYTPHFDDDLSPLFQAVAQQRWTTNLPERAVAAHDAVAAISGSDAPIETILTGLAFVRNPNEEKQKAIGAPLMPLSLGDAGYDFLTVTLTQYFFLQQWDEGKAMPGPGPALGLGEQLDKFTLANCLGGRFAPGIEMTFNIRDPWVYEQDWQSLGCGPFRIRARQMDYEQADFSQPFLTIGYVPEHPGPDRITPARIEPGDMTKMLAIPWHTDYNSCATHNPYPTPPGETTLYWSWPAQRPVAVNRAVDVRDGRPGPKHYSVRGRGTEAPDLMNAGRFQFPIDFIMHWHRIGFVIQGRAIEAVPAGAEDMYLEVGSQLDEPAINPWPMNSGGLPDTGAWPSSRD